MFLRIKAKQTSIPTNKRTNKRTNEQTNKRTNKQTNKQTTPYQVVQRHSFKVHNGDKIKDNSYQKMSYICVTYLFKRKVTGYQDMQTRAHASTSDSEQRQ